MRERFSSRRYGLEGLWEAGVRDSWREVEEAGRNPADIERDRRLLQGGIPPLDIVRPCTMGDGIGTLTDAHEAIGRSSAGRADAFVPASGAATRLFASWAAAARTGDPSLAEALEDRARLPCVVERGTQLETIRATLDRWATVPKGLVPVHHPDRTPLQEHLAEADALGLARVHFTVAEDQLAAFQEAAGGSVDFSVQDPRTDTMGFYEDLRPARDSFGRLVFRPSGHGALLTNLDRVARDLVMIKNVDNVVSDSHRAEVLKWRWRLLGRLAELHGEVLSVLERRSSVAAAILLRSRFGVTVPESRALEQLDRPLRVCGMVPDAGEPGGGPFWVCDADGVVRPQIVEAAQLDETLPSHRGARALATHFNPVEIVAAVRGPNGRWPLAPYADASTSMRVRKSHEGRNIIALERPGLWNGGMAGWNTVFVELPPATFQPIKTLADLLRPAHQG
jgi:hypothetical protein